VSPNWYVDYPKLEAENKELKAEVARFKEALDYIDDHGRALEAMEIMKAQAAEIVELKATIRELEDEIGRLDRVVDGLDSEP
jgi:cell division protein FtsB